MSELLFALAGGFCVDRAGLGYAGAFVASGILCAAALFVPPTKVRTPGPSMDFILSMTRLTSFCDDPSDWIKKWAPKAELVNALDNIQVCT